jgi:hypothetical protein
MKRLICLTALACGITLAQNIWADEDEGQPEEMVEELSEEVPEDCSCGECYEKIVKYEPCYYQEWVCKTEQVSYETKNVRWVPQYYEKLRCKYVPQYYYETLCRYVPEEYSTYDTYDVPKYECVTRCKYVPKIYFKKKCD